MPATKSDRPKQPRRPRQRRRLNRRTGGRIRILWFYLRHLLLWLVVGFVGYWLWLDREVAETFRDRQWSLPARVYARPLELYSGATVSQERLLRELRYLGYEQVATPRARGQFSAKRGAVELYARGFDFWDMPEVSRRIHVHFDSGRIATLADGASATPIDLLRLEPVEIGSINPTRFEDRRLLAYDELPSPFVNALVAVEDQRFFAHHGVDFFGLARAMWANLLAMRWAQGGSTLTQQLVKNFYLSSERTLRRKLIELMMAVSLELRFGKRDILETYVNEVFLGQDGNRAIHGFELAAQFYFGRPLAELDMNHTAVLIGMIKGPSIYDPRRHPEAARWRRDVVLDVLAREQVIDARELARIKAQPIELR
ncbi:MAG: transglycosylase domain-containing protein, partial [Gammaproteobacteria bacterium]